MRIIEHDGQRLAILISKADRRQGLSFFSEESDFIQVGMWGYQAGKHLQAHIHNVVDRQIDRTQEVICVLQGKVKCTVFTADEQICEEVIFGEGDVLVLLSGGHAYDILEDDTFVLEVKNGPYPGPEADRRRF